MEQKDGNAPARRLATAAELRGKKSGMPGGGKKGGGKMLLSLLAMVVVLGLAVGAFFLSDRIKPAEEESPQATARPSTTVKLVDHPRDDVDRVTIRLKDGETYTIVAETTTTGEGDSARTSYSYSVDGHPEFKLDQNTGASIIGYAANMTATQQVEEKAADLDAYGLKDPAITVTMNYRDGAQSVWLFGDPIPTGGGYYVCEKGKSAVFTIYSSAYTTLSAPLNSLYVLSMPVTFSSETEVKDLLVEQKGKDTVEISYPDGNENTFSISALRLVQPIFYDAHSERGTEIIQAAIALSISGYAGEKGDLPDAGLEEPRAHIQVTGREDQVMDYWVGNFKGSDQVYVQIDDSDAVYLAPASSVAFLENVKVTYLVDQFTNLVNIAKVDEFTVEADGEVFTAKITRDPVLDADGNPELNSAGRAKTNDTYYFNGEATDESLFKKLYQVIIGTMVSKECDDWDYDGDAVVTVSYKFAEDMPDFSVKYIPYDSEYYAVRRYDQTLFLIKKDRIDNLIQQLRNYRDGTFVAP